MSTATKSTNQTLQNLLELVEKVKNLKNTSKAKFEMLAVNDKELEEAARSLRCHLFKPFEQDEWDNYDYFDYCLPENRNICITVRSNQEYRYDKVLVAI